MKVRVNLPEDDIAFLDRYARDNRTTRSAALHQAVLLLRRRDLCADYEVAYDEWLASGDAGAWNAVTGDGVR